MRLVFVTTLTVFAIATSQLAPAQDQSSIELGQLVTRLEQRASKDPLFRTQMSALLDPQSVLADSQFSRDSASELVPLPDRKPSGPDVSTGSDTADLRAQIAALQDAVATLQEQVQQLRKELAEQSSIGGKTDVGGFLETSKCTLVFENTVPYSVDVDLAFNDFLDVRKVVRVTIPPQTVHEVIVHTAEGKEAITIRLPQNPQERPKLLRLAGPDYRQVVPINSAQGAAKNTPSGTTVVQRPTSTAE